MFKVNLIKKAEISELEREINNFIESKLPVEVNITQCQDGEYLASIIYKELGSQVIMPNVGSRIPPVEIVPLGTDSPSGTPFDRLSLGLGVVKED